MRKIICPYLILFTVLCNAQEFSPTTIDINNRINNEDLSFLKNELKDVQILMLGELTHDDGNVFEVKTKIIEYLHQNMGFNTIAFESGIYDVNKAYSNIKKGESVKTSLQNSLFPIWSKTHQFQSFIRFFDTNKHRLKIIGFDNQITGTYGEKYLIEDLYKYCKKHQLSFPLHQQDLELLIESILVSGIFDQNDISFSKLTNTLTNLISQIQQKPKLEIHLFWEQTIKSLLTLVKGYNPKYDTPKAVKHQKEKVYSEYTKAFSLDKNDISGIISSKFTVDKGDNNRDKQMADNLLAYIKQHPKEKIICWGANAHFTNDMSSVIFPIIKEFVPMGAYIKSKLKNKAYSLATVTAETSFNKNNFFFDTPLKPDSFEHYLSQKQSSYVFVSSNQDDMQKPQLHRLFSYKTFIKSRLDKLHDGYLFFDKSIPSTWIQEENNLVKHKNHNTPITLKIKGQITDRSSGKPIPFSNILIQSTNLGAVSDKNGNFELTYTSNFKNNLITISSIGYEEKQIPISKINKKIILEPSNTLLDEVVIQGKLSPYNILKKVIQKIPKNYPITPFNIQKYVNVDIKIEDSSFLKLEYVNKVLEKGYNQNLIPANYLIEKRINHVSKDLPLSTWEFNHYGFLPNPILASFLIKKKLKKYNLILEKEDIYDEKAVYIISFSTIRDHFAYTGQMYRSNYSGKIFIEKKNYAILKIEEYWKASSIPEHMSYIIDKGWRKSFFKNELRNETRKTFFKKMSNGLYYRNQAIVEKHGVFMTKNNIKQVYEQKLNYHWFDFRDAKINYNGVILDKKEGEFNKIKPNYDFWNTFDINSKL